MKIAYLAPEIPALSATFVYKEIQKLEELGVDIIPLSVHRPFSEATDSDLSDMKKRVCHVYEVPKHVVAWMHIILLLSTPVHYFKSLSLLLSDIVNLNLFSRNALGVCYRFFYAAVVARKITSEKCSHLHIHFAHIPSDLGMYASSLAGITFSITAHANDLFERGWLLKEKVERAAFFATISEFNKRYLSDNGVATENVKIIRCGVDEKQFSKRNPIADEKLINIGVVGRLVEKKGIDTLIQAVSILKTQGVDVQLKIVGSGPLEQELGELVEKLDLTDADVVFLGSLPNTDVANFIESLDAFVLPCKKDSKGDMDGIPVVLMEAMLSGVPVISSKLSGIPELVINERTGLLIEPGDAPQLALAISRIKRDIALKETMIGNAIETVNHSFSLSNNSKELHKLFLNAITKAQEAIV